MCKKVYVILFLKQHSKVSGKFKIPKAAKICANFKVFGIFS